MTQKTEIGISDTFFSLALSTLLHFTFHDHRDRNNSLESLKMHLNRSKNIWEISWEIGISMVNLPYLPCFLDFNRRFSERWSDWKLIFMRNVWKRYGFWRYTKYFHRIYVSKELCYWNYKLKAKIEYYYLQ